MPRRAKGKDGLFQKKNVDKARYEAEYRFFELLVNMVNGKRGKRGKRGKHH